MRVRASVRVRSSDARIMRRHLSLTLSPPARGEGIGGDGGEGTGGEGGEGIIFG